MAKGITSPSRIRLGFAGGINLYAYTGNNPVGYSDPFGLSRCPPFCLGTDLLMRAYVHATGEYELSPDEVEYYAAHPVIAFISLNYVERGDAVGQNIANRFHHRTEQSFQKMRGTARHQWSACQMTKAWGEKLARETLEAHETLDGDDATDTDNDKKNNEKGIALAKQNVNCFDGVFGNLQQQNFK